LGPSRSLARPRCRSADLDKPASLAPIQSPACFCPFLSALARNRDGVLKGLDGDVFLRQTGKIGAEDEVRRFAILLGRGYGLPASGGVLGPLGHRLRVTLAKDDQTANEHGRHHRQEHQLEQGVAEDRFALLE
jgi:hypothetical protein